ncbi:MAG: hypothetical protein ACREP1_10340, partial [Rhodanobacteraceae bacterium]
MKRTSPATLIVALLACGAVAQTSIAANAPRYVVNNLASLGGTDSEGNSINDFGLIAGFSNLAGDQSTHATAWLYGSKFDLGTLGGANSDVAWPVKNDFGVISGIAQTATPDPNGEPWSCSGFLPATGNTCLGFVWAFGKMRPLSPLPGGNNSFATGTNNRLQTVGWAENGVHDSTCDPLSGQVLQFLPVIWGPGRIQMQSLLPLYDDKDGAATAINDRGQVVGISGACDQAVGRYSARHMVLWQNGHALDLGNLGGAAWNTPTAINQRGDVAGFANVPGGATPASLHEHAFLWTRSGGLQDLGVLYPDDVHSQALGINDRGQIVGLSCTAHFAVCHGFLWQNGAMTDLNSLVVGYNGVIEDAQDINDLGQITGQAV